MKTVTNSPLSSTDWVYMTAGTLGLCSSCCCRLFVLFCLCPPKGGRGCLMSPPPCLESQGCHLIPLCYLLSCSSSWSCYPFCLIIFCLLALSSKLFPENSSIFSLRDRLFCMAPVQQLGEDSRSVVCAACCHMTLIFAVMHLYNILEFFIASVHSFFILF